MRRAFLAAVMALGLCGWPVEGQTLAFSPQGGKKAELWAVTGCGLKPLSIAQVYTIASAHGLSWITPATAADRLAKLTTWGRIARYGGFAAAGATAIVGVDFGGLGSGGLVAASAQIKSGLTYGSLFLNVLLPLVSKNVPTVDAGAGQDLRIDSNGCGSTEFYTLPTTTGPFVEKMP